MVFGWLRRRRRRRYLREETPADWSPHLERLPFTTGLTGSELRRLVAYARAFEGETEFEGCAGMEIDEDVVRSITLQACRLVLNLGLDAYRKVRTVLVYPSAFVAQAGDGEITASGLAVPNGPVILAWDHVEQGASQARDGRNVVYHEFAHKLDMLDGFVDGVPPLGCEQQFRAWKQVVGKGHRRLRLAARRGRETLIHPYGATNEAEFFAEATEVFFERPQELKRRHRALYRALKRFYRQDPAGR